MPDFTCALYLGLWHASSELRPWTQLTTGTPAAVRRVPGAATVARSVAALQGCDAATLVPSTLHGAWDLGGLLDPRRETLHVDAEIYPVLRIAALRARSRGVRVRDVAHHDAAALERSLRSDPRRPVVLVDGICPAGGAPAPLRAYLAAIRPRSGLLVVDDTQAAGILGGPGGAVPAWGRGGGGSLPHHGLERAPEVLLLTSFAKALGAPVAAIAGSAALVDSHEGHAGTSVHSSPVSVAAVHALEHALAVNHSAGEQLRRRASCAVQRFRHGLRELGIDADGGAFPVQALPSLTRFAAAALHRHLLVAGIQAPSRSPGREAPKDGRSSSSRRAAATPTSTPRSRRSPVLPSSRCCAAGAPVHGRRHERDGRRAC